MLLLMQVLLMRLALAPALASPWMSRCLLAQAVVPTGQPLTGLWHQHWTHSSQSSSWFLQARPGF